MQRTENEIGIKMAVPKDIDFIYETMEKLAVEQGFTDRFTLTSEKLKHALFGSKAFAEVLIATVNQERAAFLMFSMTNRNFDVFKGPGIYVHDLYVIDSFRRHKVATKLAGAIKKIAVERHCDRIDFVVLKKNQRALDFYKEIPDVKEVDYIHYMRMAV